MTNVGWIKLDMLSDIENHHFPWDLSTEIPNWRITNHVVGYVLNMVVFFSLGFRILSFISGKGM